MSDQGRTIKTNAAGSQEALDLSKLRASKDIPTTLPENAPNLSQCSIAPKNVHRVATQPTSRSMQSLRPSPSIATLRSEVAARTSKANSKPSRMRPNGLFSNPYYRYKGGPISRLITFLANLLKMIEQLFFKVFMPAPLPAAPSPAPTQPQHASHGTSQVEQERLKREKEARDDRLTIHRS
jgi:hypothetical protein